MKNLNEKFEAETGYASWINSEIYPDGKIHTQEYVKWLESKVEKLFEAQVESKKCKCEKPILQPQTKQCGRCKLYIDRVRHILLTSSNES